MRVSSPSALIRTSEIQEALFRFSRGVASRMRYKLVAHRVGRSKTGVSVMALSLTSPTYNI
jgi:hypothetical protein